MEIAMQATYENFLKQGNSFTTPTEDVGLDASSMEHKLLEIISC